MAKPYLTNYIRNCLSFVIFNKDLSAKLPRLFSPLNSLDIAKLEISMQSRALIVAQMCSCNCFPLFVTPAFGIYQHINELSTTK